MCVGRVNPALIYLVIMCVLGEPCLDLLSEVSHYVGKLGEFCLDLLSEVSHYVGELGEFCLDLLSEVSHYMGELGKFCLDLLRHYAGELGRSCLDLLSHRLHICVYHESPSLSKEKKVSFILTQTSINYTDTT